MRVQLLYFQNVRKITGSLGEPVDVSEGCTVGQLADLLAARHPGLRPALGSLLFAVNERHASRGDVLAPGDTIAVMPPFSGG
jgi:molybdopterin converting factor small subunit